MFRDTQVVCARTCTHTFKFKIGVMKICFPCYEHLKIDIKLLENLLFKKLQAMFSRNYVYLFTK